MELSITGVKETARPDIERWAAITIENWQYNIAKQKLITPKHYSKIAEPTTQHLLNSFMAHVTYHAEGNSFMVNFAFNYYLRLLDMGVGKGTQLNQVASNSEDRRYGSRKRKKYDIYSRTLYAEVMRLQELMSKYYLQHGAEIILNAFQNGNNQPTRIKINISE